jgi:hypothetical protein
VSALGLLFSLPLPIVILVFAMMILAAVHVVRTHQQLYWIWIIVIAPGLGALIYILAIMLPEWTNGTAARRMGQAARETLDPGRNYRTAKAAHDETPTVQNAMKLAEAAVEMGRWQEAETLYGGAAQGLYADDPALLLGRARAQMELGRPADALSQVEHLATLGPVSPQADLVRARALQGLGRLGDAERSFKSAYDRMPGLEAIARYAGFLAETGRKDEARVMLRDIEARAAKTRGQFRREAAAWRDYAAQRIGT